MRCPACRADSDRVIDSRPTEGGAGVRRRRECLSCGRRYTTRERVEDELRLVVIKSNGSRMPYQREKIQDGLERACTKLPITEAQIEQIVDHVEEDLFRAHDREVSSEQIGRLVARHLRPVNAVAYVRFMSVYRKFSTIQEFIDEIQDVRDRVALESPQQRPLFD